MVVTRANFFICLLICEVLALWFFFLTRNIVLNKGVTDFRVIRRNSSIKREEVKIFAYLKVPKTGSSTMYTILSRFALDRKLDIITPDRPVYLLLNSPGKKGKVWKIGPKNHSKGDVVMHHAIYKDYLYDKYLKAGYKLIVSVREPVAWFKSAVKFYHKEVKDKNAEEIILNSKYFHEKRRLFHNRQLHYLGFTNPYGRFNMSEVKDFIAKMINRVDIIILNEQYDASLLIMMKRFGWKYSDLFYNKMRVLNTFNNSFSNRAIDKLLSKEYNLRDKIYYKEMNKTWWAQPELLEEGFWDEVAYFAALNKRVMSNECPDVLKNKHPIILPVTQYHGSLNLTVIMCRRILSEWGGLMDCVINYVFQRKNQC